jgi:hypothetical protein
VRVELQLYAAQKGREQELCFVVAEGGAETVAYAAAEGHVFVGRELASQKALGSKLLGLRMV